MVDHPLRLWNGGTRVEPGEALTQCYIEGRSPHDRWEELQAYRQQYDHPLWKDLDERAAGGGHGGMDYIEDFRLVQCLRQGAPMDMDIYDGAAWTAVIMLSEQSIAQRSRSVDFPDFTRGAWRTRPPLGIIDVTGRAVVPMIKA